ncbi:MAG TPA: hypothetical protein VEG33_00155, partial [Streptosporangiaceae bacterium]|nr:hypothetical protein [Streptosporangiaceae bacterium]
MPWSRLAAVAVLGLLGLAAPHVPALGLGACAAAVVITVAVLDHYLSPPAPGWGRSRSACEQGNLAG